MKYRERIMKTIISCLLLINLPLMAADLKSEKSQKIAQQLVRSINQKLTEIAELEIAAGVKPENIVIDLSQRQRFDSGRFGAIIDAKQLGKVLSVTPNSPAFLIGLHSGDVILSVNNTMISQENTNWRKQLQYAQDNTQIKLTVLRDNKKQQLTGSFQAKYTPQWQLNSSKKLLLDENNDALTKQQAIEPTAGKNNTNIDNLPAQGCGRVIVGKTFKKRALDKFTGLTSIAVITSINGKPILRGKTRFRLPVGRHSFNIGTLYNDNASGTKFALTIAPNTNYYIANVISAKWVDAQGNYVSSKPYTGPVVYQTLSKECEL